MTKILDTDEAPDDFSELDALLAGAVKLAEARKQARKPRSTVTGSLTPEDIEQLAHANDLLTWEDEYAVARFVESHCLCGSSHTRFDGWFIVSQHRRDASARRFRRNGGHEGLPAWKTVVAEETAECAECLSNCDLPLATSETFEGIEALGQPCECNYGQLALALDAAEDAAIDEGDSDLSLFDELEEENAQIH
jgi:hypothetical protein